MKQAITGFHAVEERVRRAVDSNNTAGIELYYTKAGPRIKKILEVAKESGIKTAAVTERELSVLVQNLPESARDHRGLVMLVEDSQKKALNLVDFDGWIAEQKLFPDKSATVIILDSVTDPHNVGAIIRSCDQFGCDLVVVPSRRGAGDTIGSEIVARSSAGAVAYVPVAVVTNLTRSAQQLKDAGFWIYGADAGGETIQKIDFSAKSAIIMGSEGSGMGKLVKEQCDTIVSIPTCGNIDSLNVSVAAGVLLYERYRQSLSK